MGMWTMAPDIAYASLMKENPGRSTGASVGAHSPPTTSLARPRPRILHDKMKPATGPGLPG